MVVNHKKIRRLMREHDLQPRQRRCYVATTDSDHDQPIYPNRTKDLTIDGPNQLWVADITYVAIVEGFAYVAIILDARRVGSKLDDLAAVRHLRSNADRSGASYSLRPTCARSAAEVSDEYHGPPVGSLATTREFARLRRGDEASHGGRLVRFGSGRQTYERTRHFKTSVCFRAQASRRRTPDAPAVSRR